MTRKIFAYGCGSPIRLPVVKSIAHGSLANDFIANPYPFYRGGDSIIWGLIRGANEIMIQTRQSGFNYYQIDNAYFGRNLYFRVTENALQINHLPKIVINNRYKLILDQIDKKILDWKRKRNGPIVICPSSDFLFRYMGTSCDLWIDSVVRELAKITDRPYVVRYKESMAKNEIESEINNAWCVITHVSAAALDALRIGIPVVTTANCAATCLSTPLSQIENPIMLDGREELFSLLANSQFTKEEMFNSNIIKVVQELS